MLSLKSYGGWRKWKLFAISFAGIIIKMLYQLCEKWRNWWNYHDQKINILKLGCTLPHLANICLHKSTDRKLYPFIEADKDLHEMRSEVTGGPSIAFTRKAVVDKTFIQRSIKICKAIDGIDDSQLYPFSMCQAMPTGLYARWELDTNLQKFKARQNKIRKFENMVMSFY